MKLTGEDIAALILAQVAALVIFSAMFYVAARYNKWSVFTETTNQ